MLKRLAGMLKAAFPAHDVRGYLFGRAKAQQPENKEAGMQRQETDGVLSEGMLLAGDDIDEILSRYFAGAEMLLFISAAGIAVRKCAPYLKSKAEDPAVLCMDNAGRYVIPLLSGHLGGANRWAGVLARMSGAEAVLTTATDRHGVFAVDVFARDNHLWFEDKRMIKEVSARLLAGETIGLYSKWRITGEKPALLTEYAEAAAGQVPDGAGHDRGDAALEAAQRKGIPSGTGRPECGIVITDDPALPKQFMMECRLYPQNLHLGIGCRKGREGAALKRFVMEQLKARDIRWERIRSVSSVERKAEEAGIKALAAELAVPFRTYTAAELEEVPGDFSESAFVRAQTGTGNVCERAAMRSAGEGGRLIIAKTAGSGMTLAVAAAEADLFYGTEG